MKKKILYGLFMAFFACAAVGTLQSCKDDLDDFEHEYAYDQYQLSGVIDDLRATIDAAKADCAAKIADLQAQITANDGDIAKLQNDLQSLAGEVANRVTIDQLNQRLAQLESDYKAYTDSKTSALKTELEQKITTEIGAVKGLITTLRSDMETKFSEVNGKITKLTNDLTTANGKIDANTTAINKLNLDIAAANAQIELNQQAIAAINKELENVGKTLREHENLIADLYDKYTALDQKIDSVKEELLNEINQLWQQVAQNSEMIGQVYTVLSDRIDAVEVELAKVQEELNELTNRVNDLLTGIILQGVDNPIFGNFSLPIGVRSNIAFDWFGQFANDVVFPSALTENTYNAEPCVLTEADLAFLKNSQSLQTAEYEAGYQTNGTLGTVYMTLNPIGHNLTENKEFSLETSAGRKAMVEFKPVKSDKEITFGYTRADNGFYEAEVVMPATQEAVGSVGVVIEQGLKDATKDILNDFSKRNALNLLKAVYDQLDGFLPAYALRADWLAKVKENGAYVKKSFAVLSGYDLAVATAKPLSYKFLYGKGTDRQLPTFGHMDNFILALKDNGDLHFDFSDLTVDLGEQSITLPNITISAKVGEITVPTITVTIEQQEVDDNNGGTIIIPEQTVDVPADQLAELTNNIKGAINSALDQVKDDIEGWSTEANKELQKQVDKMMDNIEASIKKMMTDISGEINDKIDGILDDFGGKAQPWFDRLNKVLDVYNKVAGKINNFLKNPNAYLQVAAFYKANGGIGILSSVKDDPTIFSGNGEAFTLFLSSYTAETVCPAFKKYAAIVNVYNENGVSVRDAEWQNIARMNANSSGLNRVLDGRTFKINVPAGMKAGYTYELVYQGLDYSGVTSTRKFYIKVQ